MVSVRTIVHELEARLVPVDAGAHGGASGRIERKTYGNAEARLKVKVRGLDDVAGTAADVVVDGARVASIALRGGAGKLDLRAPGDDRIPAMRRGDRVEIVTGGRVLLSGVLEED